MVRVRVVWYWEATLCGSGEGFVVLRSHVVWFG